MSAEAVAFLDEIKTFFKGNAGLDGEPGVQGPAGGYFPTSSAGWGNFLAARTALATRLHALPPSAGWRDPSSFEFPAAGSNSNSYGDVKRLPNGDLFYVPFNRSTPYIRSVSGSFSACPSIDAPVLAGISGGALLPRSGRMAMIAYSYSKLLAYNPVTRQFDTLKDGLTGEHKWLGGGFDLAGILWHTPHRSKRIVAYDEGAVAGSEWWQSDDLEISDYAYAGPPILLPNGKLMFVPYNETRAMFIDPVSRAVTFGPAAFPGNETFNGGRPIDATKVITYPHKYGKPAIYDWQSGVFTPFPAAIGTLGIAGFNGGVYLPYGHDLLVPYQSGQAWTVDVENGTAKALPGTYAGEGAHRGGCVMDDGNTALAPFNAANPAFVQTGQGLRLDPEFLLSAYR